MTLAISTGAPFSAVLGIGGYRPRRVVDNAEICTLIDSSDEWIQTRSGIRERRWAGDDETVQMMSVAAARKAIDRSGVDAARIDAVIVATVTHLYQTPAIATAIAAEVGAVGAAAFDVSAACAGFCYGLAMADSFVRTGTAGHVLVIGVERLSDLTNREDRSTAFLFADGAGAAVVGPSDQPGIGPVVWGSDGDQAGLITQTESWDAAMEAETPHWPTLRMDGNPVFKWASYTMAKAAAEALSRAGLRPEDLDVFVPHQANMRITDAMFRALKLPSDVVIARDIQVQGNTSAASIPLAIEALLESGEAKTGQTALIIGFGAGLVYAGQVIVLP
ncbi:ketoacyl-ACP synthase III [Microlunatus panaciterrae]|uniref:Beta-ketoacyl-[acyl-carrier-protein] synthase III n=1 Tax=Microlunatus panaciterrae TaxID=400768 RepID=A0ABS2RF28_9ACTN|nr:beta-ketoacyl-ACP synthase III [Microlunatus panaciterrae]MBM7797600.1 3-oxoacyl-[acyl-carrier-protein] synthase-3 [Microlunatus panaciterrae]